MAWDYLPISSEEEIGMMAVTQAIGEIADAIDERVNVYSRRTTAPRPVAGMIIKKLLVEQVDALIANSYKKVNNEFVAQTKETLLAEIFGAGTNEYPGYDVPICNASFINSLYEVIRRCNYFKLQEEEVRSYSYHYGSLPSSAAEYNYDVTYPPQECAESNLAQLHYLVSEWMYTDTGWGGTVPMFTIGGAVDTSPWWGRRDRYYVGSEVWREYREPGTANYYHRRYRCILEHHISDDSEPEVGANWETYWVRIPNKYAPGGNTGVWHTWRHLNTSYWPELAEAHVTFKRDDFGYWGGLHTQLVLGATEALQGTIWPGVAWDNTTELFQPVNVALFERVPNLGWPGWTPETYYAAGSQVHYKGKYYTAKVSHTSAMSSAPPNVLRWELYAPYTLQFKLKCADDPSADFVLPLVFSSEFESEMPDTWLVGTAYAVGNKVVCANRYYNCTAAHTASTGDRPGSGANWQNYWERIAGWDIYTHAAFGYCIPTMQHLIAKAVYNKIAIEDEI